MNVKDRSDKGILGIYQTVEKMVLGTILFDSKMIQMALDYRITSEMFYHPLHSGIWECMLNMLERGIPNFTVVEIVHPLCEARGLEVGFAVTVLNEMADQSTIDFPHALRQMHFYYRERERKKCISMANEAMGKNSRTDEEQRDFLDEAVSRLGELQTPFVIETDSERVKKAWERINKALSSGKDPRREYGWNIPGLDSSPVFPVSSSELTIIGARPSTGKSSILRQMSESLFNSECPDKGIRLIFTREVKEHDWLYQMATSLSGVPLSSMQVWKPEEKHRWKKAYDMVGMAVENKRLIIRHDMKTIEDVVKYTRSVAKNIGQISFFGLDYLQQYTSSKGKSRDEGIGITTSTLKELAMDLDIPVVVPCQLNREVDRDSKSGKSERAPQLSDLRESGNIEQDADKVVLLWKPSKNSAGSDNNAGNSPYEVHILKKKDRNRNQFGDVRMIFNPLLRRFSIKDAEHEQEKKPPKSVQGELY